MIRFAGHLALTIVTTAMFVFGGLLIVETKSARIAYARQERGHQPHYKLHINNHKHPGHYMDGYKGWD